MNEPPTKKAVSNSSRTNWNRIDRMTDDDIDYSDQPPLDEAFWAEAEWWLPVEKARISLRLDHDVIE